MATITGRLDRLTHVTGETWRIKLKGRKAVNVTATVLDGVRLDHQTVYVITLDETRSVVRIGAVA